jgi:hypothetical protein
LPNARRKQKWQNTIKQQQQPLPHQQQHHNHLISQQHLRHRSNHKQHDKYTNDGTITIEVNRDGTGQWIKAMLIAEEEDGTVDVMYEESGDIQYGIPIQQIRPLQTILPLKQSKHKATRVRLHKSKGRLH